MLGGELVEILFLLYESVWCFSFLKKKCEVRVLILKFCVCLWLYDAEFGAVA